MRDRTGYPERVRDILDFIESLKLPDGKGAGQPFVLDDWQIDVIVEVYSRDDNDERIVTQALLSVGRKNGKTALIAALLLVHLCGPEAVPFGQLYSVAFDRNQASIVFNYAKHMVLLDKDLSDEIQIVDSQKKMIHNRSGSVSQALSAEARSHHGKSASFLVFDELAQFGADDELYNVMRTSIGAHGRNALTWVISTQAKDDLAILSQLIDHGKRINAGEIDDPSFKAFVYAADKDLDDPWDEETWKKANPGLGSFRPIDDIRDLAKKAQSMPSFQPAFFNLYLNMRVDSQAHFVTPDIWRANGEKPDEGFLIGRRCFGGLDLSGKNDLTAFILVFPDDHWQHYDVVCRFWTPGDMVMEKTKIDKVPYETWVDQGHMIARPGKTIDYRWVARELDQIRQMYDIASVGFDRYRMADLQRELADLGVYENDINFVPHGQGYKDMSPAVEALEDALLEKRLRHGMHPVLTWNISNTIIISDPAENRKFDKVRSTGRIDGSVALAMAIRVAEKARVDEESAGFEEGLFFG